MNFVLVVFDGPKPRVFPLDRAVLGVGRDPSSDVRLTDGTVADRHCVVQRHGEVLEIFDLSSSLGTYKNGRRIEAADLASGDELRFGGVRAVIVDPDAIVLPPGVQAAFLPKPSTKPGRRGRPPETSGIDASLVRGLRKTPGFVLSIFAHAVLYVCLLLLAVETVPELKRAVTLMTEVVDPIGAVEDDVRTNEDVLTEERANPTETPSPSEIEGMETATATDALDAVGSGDEANESSASAIGLLGGDGASGESSSGEIGVLRDLPGGALGKNIASLRASGLDIVVAIDSSGSMDAEIESARKKIADMIALLDSLRIGFRLGIVTFRDKGDDYVVKAEPLTAQRFKAVDFLDTIAAGGGGDEPEAVFEAMTRAVEMSWSPKATRIIVLVGDAQPHAEDLQRTYALVRRFASNRGQVHTIYTETSGAHRVDREVVDVFRKLAEDGAGRALSLENERRLIEDILCLAFGTDDRAQMATLLKDSVEGWQSKMVRGRVDAGDAEFVVKQLTSKEMNPVVPRELLNGNREALLPAYLDVLYSERTPLGNKWLATCLLHRLVKKIEARQLIGRDARLALREYSPDLTAPKQQRVLKNLARAFVEQRLLEPAFLDRWLAPKPK